MRKVIVGIVVVAIVAIGFWWLRKGKSDTPATASTPHAGSSVQSSRVEPAVQATLQVLVKDDKGPLKAAHIRIAPTDGDVMVLESGGDGVATIKLAPGSYAVSASAKDHEPMAHEAKIASGETTKLVLTLATGGRALTGTVSDVSGGAIAGARIDAARLGGSARPDAAIATAITDKDGKYALTVPEGQLLVAARSNDYAAQSKYIDVGAAGATLDFALVPGGVIEGVVLDDRSKQPVQNARVVARLDSPSILLAEGGARFVLASSDGRFRISGLRPGAYELDARAEGRRTKSPTQVGLGVAEQVTDVQLLVGKAPAVRGTVVDDANAPIAGATVRAMDELGEEAKSDAKGAFVIDGLRAGNHVLIASADTHLITTPATLDVTDKDVDGVVIRMKKAGKLKGHVEPRQAGCDIRLEIGDLTGNIVEDGPMMRMSAAPSSTKADGSFELGPLVPGKLALAARCATGDQGTVDTTWSNATTDVVINVTPGGSIAGKLVDGDGKPVVGATVAANPSGPQTQTTIVNGVVTSGIHAITGATGAYELKGLAAGKYRMSALDRGRPLRMKKEPPAVTLAAAEKKTGVDLAADRPNGVIKGVVTGPDGKPLADAWVSVQQDLGSMIESAIGRRPPDGDKPEGDGTMHRMVAIEMSDDGEGGGGGGGAYPPALTDAQGRFEISGLPHLAFDVVAEAKAGKLRGRSEGVTPDATLTIKTLGVTSLSGTVRGSNGPAGLFVVELDGPTRTQQSFTDGTFTLGRVDPGDYVVKVRSSEGNGEAKVTVMPNAPANVDISLIANAVVVGVIVDQNGKPVPNVPVTIVEDTGDGKVRVEMQGMPKVSGPDGKFRIEHKAGKAMLIVMARQMSPPRKITLEAGKQLDAGTIQVEAR
jgi:hypothetical protein